MGRSVGRGYRGRLALLPLFPRGVDAPAHVLGAEERANELTRLVQVLQELLTWDHYIGGGGLLTEFGTCAVTLTWVGVGKVELFSAMHRCLKTSAAGRRARGNFQPCADSVEADLWPLLGGV